MNAVYTSCDEKNPCENAGICKKHGHRYECVCTSVFGGPFCGDCEYKSLLDTCTKLDL